MTGVRHCKLCGGADEQARTARYPRREPHPLRVVLEVSTGREAHEERHKMRKKEDQKSQAQG